ncbi:MAG: ribonuclease HII [Betaproteobacteria bacterium]|nr:ribonuclease HII [Betaproteobacteria bacterium]
MYVCGVDEAGRGPWAGPVYAAAVVLDEARPIEGLADSKQLSPRRRTVLADAIKARAAAWSLGVADVDEIDRLNILNATLEAMRRAVAGLALRPGEVLVDGLHCPRVPCPVRAIVRGDQSVAEISAASILAKVARDAHMLRLHEAFPQYGFDRHKGYGTAAHLEALRRWGATPAHRRSFRPVRAFLAEVGQVDWTPPRSSR